MSAAQIDRVARLLEGAACAQLRVVVVHRPMAVTRAEDTVSRLRGRMTFAGKCQLEFKAFKQVALATISCERAERVERTISPQELVHYRDNWYIDSWCHLRKGIRSFGLDAIEDVQILDVPAQEVDTAELRRIAQGSYGILPARPRLGHCCVSAPTAHNGCKQSNGIPNK